MPNGTPVVNLAFGDWDEEKQIINDITISDNKDRDKILATVASTVIDFANRHGNIAIYVKGSNPGRTRLYQIGINANKAPIETIFNIYGLTPDGWQKFESGTNYLAFLVIRK